MFERKVFREQMYCIEESTCDIVGVFGARGLCAPLLRPDDTSSETKLPASPVVQAGPGPSPVVPGPSTSRLVHRLMRTSNTVF